MLYRMYFKKAGSDTVENCIDSFRLVLQEVPMSLGVKPKAFAKRTWHDEDGDDEFLPPQAYAESFDLTCKFMYKGESGSANAVVRTFADYLMGIGGSGTELSLWDDWSKCGFVSARLSDIKINTQYRVEDGENDGDDDIIGLDVVFRILTPRDHWQPNL